MQERYATEKSAVAYETVKRDVLLQSDPKEYVWKCAYMALESRDPESLSGVLRVADEMSESTDVRFSIAVQAMQKKYYDCAYAAWDDGGRCWSQERENNNVPDSKFASIAMLNTCSLLIPSTSHIAPEEERELCEMMKNNIN
ncbi:hypothetical protein TetV_007 [Tetraselmis virus 1]|uniref:Uncharacterized protein n=1 Tax=Tetraselmis virus 1 TaxID=2060617 RepID=A0A2P0VMZ6_9VIRU|nr:hypothetical protein QJ968_gp007 [Tetraselmis virus 1]AUF82099.1 hypothetical protein TetV_007 [Tetraselmis virus 1]